MGVHKNEAAAQVPISRLVAFGQLDESEHDLFRQLAGPPIDYAARETVRRQGDRNEGVFMLWEGWVLSSLSFADGSRQIVKVHLPGDVLGAPSLPYAEAVETLSVLTRARISFIPADALGEIFLRAPRLAARLFLAAQEERVVLMDRLAAIGRLGASGSIAALLVHLYDRLSLVEAVPSTRITVPLTQTELGDILGLTSVHVNRVLQAMERAGQLRRTGRIFDLLDLEKLRAVARIPSRTIVRDLGWLPPA